MSIIQFPPLLDCGNLFALVYVATDRIKVDLLAKTSVLVFNRLDDDLILHTLEHLLIVHAGNLVEDTPHEFVVVDATQVITDFEAEDDLVEL